MKFAFFPLIGCQREKVPETCRFFFLTKNALHSQDTAEGFETVLHMSVPLYS